MRSLMGAGGGRGCWRAWARRGSGRDGAGGAVGRVGFALMQDPSGAAVAGHWAESVPSPPPTASAGSPAFVPSTVSLDARRAGNPGALLRRVNCCLLSGAMDPAQSLVSYDTNS